MPMKAGLPIKLWFRNYPSRLWRLWFGSMYNIMHSDSSSEAFAYASVISHLHLYSSIFASFYSAFSSTWDHAPRKGKLTLLPEWHSHACFFKPQRCQGLFLPVEKEEKKSLERIPINLKDRGVSISDNLHWILALRLKRAMGLITF